MCRIGLFVLKKQTKYPSIFVIYLLLWTVINLLFLVVFPFMHTDESWLAGLSRTIMTEKNPAATEPFFELVKRAPHAIKIIFHGFQILFIRAFGYRLFSVRFFSLLTGTGCLFLFGEICRRLRISKLSGTILLSVQIQFIYASHFARQEIQILFLMLLSIVTALSTKKGSAVNFRRGILTGIPVAAAIGFHPNAFIAAWPPALLLLGGIVKKKPQLERRSRLSYSSRRIRSFFYFTQPVIQQ